jgi:two-component sensor histidine kinase
VLEPKEAGFGSRLIRSSLQAFGELTLAYEPSGLVLEVTMQRSKLKLEEGDAG